jgi:hypothetical protein
MLCSVDTCIEKEQGADLGHHLNGEFTPPLRRDVPGSKLL